MDPKDDRDWSEFIPPERVVELAGHWKHGYIPLDATAMNEKMKGNTGGKKWWAIPKPVNNRKKTLTTKEVPSAGFKKRPKGGGPAKGDSKAPYQNGKMGSMNETNINNQPLDARDAETLARLHAKKASNRKLTMGERTSLSALEGRQRRTADSSKIPGASQASKNQIRLHQAAAARGQGKSLTEPLPPGHGASLQDSKDAQARIVERAAAKKLKTVGVNKKPSTSDPSGELAPGTQRMRSYHARMSAAPAATMGVTSEAEYAAKNYVVMHGTAKAREAADKIMFKKGKISGRDKANYQALNGAISAAQSGKA